MTCIRLYHNAVALAIVSRRVDKSLLIIHLFRVIPSWWTSYSRPPLYRAVGRFQHRNPYSVPIGLSPSIRYLHLSMLANAVALATFLGPGGYTGHAHRVAIKTVPAECQLSNMQQITLRNIPMIPHRKIPFLIA